eukprot:TRINITY_DN8924_c0_g1_i1.p1 TRINITY_DN8924_c0_g1~~TRINITY_DN8924_c0_g1_i1.p1  ORF type:complete len:344 (+),score=131.13 TRINITY_DN8924_c0_g1_i1:48-1079(+)
MHRVNTKIQSLNFLKNKRVNINFEKTIKRKINNSIIRPYNDSQLQIINGTLIANEFTKKTEKKVQLLKKETGLVPNLAVIQVGNDERSRIYIDRKRKAANQIGINVQLFQLSNQIQQKTLLDLVEEINLNDDIHGLIVQLPLPNHISSDAVFDNILYSKDVDGFHHFNASKLLLKDTQPLIIPCTPKGIIEMINYTGIDISYKKAVVIGRSRIVGQPTFQLLASKLGMTVTLCHSKTPIDLLANEISKADLIVSAVGHPNLVKSSWLKPNSLVIDVGITAIQTENQTRKIVGDVEWDQVLLDSKGINGKPITITPVPGGVGPMTVAMLLENTLQCANMINSKK